MRRPAGRARAAVGRLPHHAGAAVDRLVELSLARPRRVVAVAAALLLLAVVGLTQLRPTASTESIVGGGSDAARANAVVADRFGDDPVVVLVRQRVSDLVLTGDLARLIGLEGCLSGRVPTGVTPPGGADGPCGRLADLEAAEIVYGPGTFVNTSVQQIADQITSAQRDAVAQVQRAREAARQLARRQGRDRATQAEAADQAEQAVVSGLARRLLELRQIGVDATRPPSISDREFVARIVFDNGADVAGTPKRRFAALFPSRDTAAIQVRLQAGLSADDRAAALTAIRDATAMPEWRLQGGGSYDVTGAPVLAAGLQDRMVRSLLVLLGAGVLAMGLVLALAFPARRRLLPLLLAGGAVVVVGGALGGLGIALTLGTLATLPVLLGLGVDYGVQIQARIEARRRAGEPEEQAVRGALAGTGRSVLVAAAATLAGIAALLLSPTPLARGFAALLAVGVVLAVLAAFTVGVALPRRLDARPPAARSRRLGAAVAGAWSEARRMLGRLVPRGRRWRPRPGAVIALGRRRPRAVLAVGAVLAVVGWGAGASADVETDVQRLAPSDLPSLQGIRELQRTSGVAGEVSVLVQADDAATPASLAWMADYRRRVLADARYSDERGCGRADLCPALSLTDLFRSPAARRSEEAIDGLLAGLPPYFVRGVLSPERDAGVLRFGIRLAPSDEQAEIVRRMRDQLDPPEGVEATVTGLPVLVADAAESTGDPVTRLGITAVGLLLVALVLRWLLGTWRRAGVPLVPIAMATGWSGLLVVVLEPLGLTLNPLSALLGALVVAVATEFSVLLAERHRRERAAGADPDAAIARTLAATGRSVAVSAGVAVTGFAVLVLSDVPLLRDFGLLTVLDLGVAVLAVALVLPALATLAERRQAAPGRADGTVVA